MVRTMIPKTDYVPCAKVGENIYRLMFNREDVEQDVLQENDEGKQVPTGEKEATDYCNVNLEMLYYKPSPDFVVKLLSDVGIVDLSEASEILSNFTEEPLSYLQALLLHNIETFDTSPSVNGFLLNGSVEWIDIDLRVKLCTRTLPEEKKAGKTSTVLWLGNKPYDLPIETIEQIMHEIEIYAKECLDVTNRHKALVSTLSGVDDVVNCDYTAGYPEKLSFNI